MNTCINCKEVFEEYAEFHPLVSAYSVWCKICNDLMNEDNFKEFFKRGEDK